jgi:hypothetical protein
MLKLIAEDIWYPKVANFYFKISWRLSALAPTLKRVIPFWETLQFLNRCAGTSGY